MSELVFGADPDAVEFEISELLAAMRSSYHFYGNFALPDDFTLVPPNFYESLWVMILEALGHERAFEKFALGFPRGHSKTVFLKLLVSLAIGLGRAQFILIVCANESRAKDFIRDVIALLDSPNLRAVFGNWRSELSVDKAEQKVFKLGGRTICLAGGGPGTSLRGFNVGNARPDFIIADDAQTKECAESRAEATAFIKWFSATLMKLKNPERCTYVYVGNMYPDMKLEENLYACQLRNLQKSRSWKSFIVGAILADGTALWEELHPLNQLLDEYISDLELGQGDVFASEVLNDPDARPAAGFDPTKIKIIEPMPFELHQGSAVIIDPAGRKKTSDGTAIGYVELWDAVPTLVELTSEVRTPLQTIHDAIQLAIRKGCNVIAVEAVAYQESLLFWFEVVAQQLGIHGIEFVPLHTGGISKNARILSSIKALMRGELALGPAAVALYTHQALMFRAHKVDNVDDGLDILAYCPKVFELYQGIMVLPGTASAVSPTALISQTADSAESSF